MEFNQPPHLHQKSSSFCFSRDEKPQIGRKLSLGSIKIEHGFERKERRNEETIAEGEENEEEENAEEKEKATKVEGEEQDETSNVAEEPEANLGTVSEDVDRFLDVLLSVEDGHEPPEIPESTVEKFVTLVEEEIVKYETGDEKWPSDNDELTLFAAVDRVSRLTSAVTSFSSDPKYNQAMNRTGTVLHHATSKFWKLHLCPYKSFDIIVPCH